MAPGLGPDRSVGWGSTDRDGNNNATTTKWKPMVDMVKSYKRNAQKMPKTGQK
jgi:hypothetical protein